MLLFDIGALDHRGLFLLSARRSVVLNGYETLRPKQEPDKDVLALSLLSYE